MANITIPNLPSQTATTDLDLLVITDSGETTTSKITKADFLSDLVTGNLVSGAGTGSYTTPGRESSVTGTNALLLGGTGGSVGGTKGVSIGGDGNICNNNTGAVVAGGTNTNGGGGQYNGIFAGYINQIDNGYGVVIIGGNGNRIYGASDSQMALGTQAAKLNATNNNSKAFSVIGDQNSVCIDNGWGAIVSSYQCGINGTGTYTDTSNKIDGQHQLILNSRSSFMTGTTADGSNYSSIISSNGCKIGPNVDYVNIIGCQNYEADTSNVVVVPGMVITNYSTLNYADDSAAATGGVPLGGVYHNAGDLRVRIA